MIVTTPNGPVNTSGPVKCRKCRRMFVGEKKPGDLTISNGKIKFICYQCKPKEKSNAVLPNNPVAPDHPGVPPQPPTTSGENQAVAGVVGQARPLNG